MKSNILLAADLKKTMEKVSRKQTQRSQSMRECGRRPQYTISQLQSMREGIKLGKNIHEKETVFALFSKKPRRGRLRSRTLDNNIPEHEVKNKFWTDRRRSDGFISFIERSQEISKRLKEIQSSINGKRKLSDYGLKVITCENVLQEGSNTPSRCINRKFVDTYLAKQQQRIKDLHCRFDLPAR